MGPQSHGCHPVGTVGRNCDLVEDEINDAVENVVLAGDVVVQRHGFGAQFIGDVPNAEEFNPPLIGDDQGGGQYTLSAQRSPLHAAVGLGLHSNAPLMRCPSGRRLLLTYVQYTFTFRPIGRTSYVLSRVARDALRRKSPVMNTPKRVARNAGV